MIRRAILFLAVLLSVRAAAGDEPWRDAFHPDAGAVLESVRDLRLELADVLMDYQDAEYSLGSDHLAIYRRRWVYRILDPSGLERWSVSEARWSPSYQHRPELRARVIHPDGRVRWLDESAYKDPASPAPALGGEPSVRVLRAKLDGLEVDAVVEEEIVLRDFRPLFCEGIAVRAVLALPAPIHRGRLIVKAPRRLSYRIGLATSLEPRREDLGERVRLTLDYRGLPAVDLVSTSARAPRPGDPSRRPRPVARRIGL